MVSAPTSHVGRDRVLGVAKRGSLQPHFATLRPTFTHCATIIPEKQIICNRFLKFFRNFFQKICQNINFSSISDGVFLSFRPKFHKVRHFSLFLPFFVVPRFSPHFARASPHFQASPARSDLSRAARPADDKKTHVVPVRYDMRFLFRQDRLTLRQQTRRSPPRAFPRQRQQPPPAERGWRARPSASRR